MNDMSPADDELLSSYLDDEATPDEVARIESDPTLLARVEELRAARDLIATPVSPLAAAEIDALIESALEASATTPVVTGIERARRRRSDRVRMVVAVAAGVLLLAIAVPVLGSLGGDSDDADTASVALDGGDTASDDEAADNESFAPQAVPAEDTTAGDDTSSATAEADIPGDADAADAADETNDDASDDTPAITALDLYDLEPALDEEQLGRAIEDRLRDRDLTAEVFTAGALETLEELACAEEFSFLAATDELTVVDAGVTAVGGTPTAVVVVSDADGDYLLYTTPLETCTPIAILELGG